MTLESLKSTTTLLLIGDNDLPEDEQMLINALEMAYLEISNKVSALKLLSTIDASDIIRMGPGGSYVRMPRLPTQGIEELDIDNELCPAVARIIASYVSRNKGSLHQQEADKIMNQYESKVRRFLEDEDTPTVAVST